MIGFFPYAKDNDSTRGKDSYRHTQIYLAEYSSVSEEKQLLFPFMTQYLKGWGKKK